MNVKRWIYLTPVDTVCCRDGRPFAAGETTLGRTIFPPFPSTFYGALRTGLLVASGKSITDFRKQKKPYPDLPEVGTIDEQGTLRIGGAILCHHNEALENISAFFSCPANLVMEKENETQWHFLVPKENDPPAAEVSDIPDAIRLIMPPPSIAVTSLDGYLHQMGATGILRGGILPQTNHYKPAADIVGASWQVGLKRIFRARTAEQGQLYSISHHRIRDGNDQSAGFLLWIEMNGCDCLNSLKMIKLGGEARAAKVRMLPDEWSLFSDDDYRNIVEKISKNKRFFIWLVTPAIFGKGWCPDFLNSANNGVVWDDLSVRLASVRISGFRFAGGFKLGDGAAGGSKSGVRAVREGSVYFFSIEEAPDQQTLEKFVRNRMMTPMTGQAPETAAQGYGTTLIGGY